MTSNCLFVGCYFFFFYLFLDGFNVFKIFNTPPQRKVFFQKSCSLLQNFVSERHNLLKTMKFLPFGVGRKSIVN